jgi:hypothetical protein
MLLKVDLKFQVYYLCHVTLNEQPHLSIVYSCLSCGLGEILQVRHTELFMILKGRWDPGGTFWPNGDDGQSSPGQSSRVPVRSPRGSARFVPRFICLMGMYSSLGSSCHPVDTSKKSPLSSKAHWQKSFLPFLSRRHNWTFLSSKWTCAYSQVGFFSSLIHPAFPPAEACLLWEPTSLALRSPDPKLSVW